MKTKHTPGPWTVEQHPDSGWMQIWKQNIKIATINQEHANDGIDDEANARLIAAAPELLSACSETLKYLDHEGDCRHDPDPTYDCTGHIRMGRSPYPVCSLERALAKATKEQK